MLKIDSLKPELNRTALLSGVRVTVACLLPLVVGQLLGQPGVGFAVALGGLNVANTDPGGPYRVRALTMGVATVGIAFSALVGTLAGNIPWLAILLMFMWAFVGGLAPIYGNTGFKATFSTIIIYLIMAGLHSGFDTALQRFEGFMAGGLWSMALTLWVWPLWPYRPVLRSVAAYYRALADFISVACQVDGQTEKEEEESKEPDEIETKRNAAASAGNKAREYLISIRSSRQGSSALGRNLVALELNASNLFNVTLRLVKELEIASRRTQFEQLKPQVEKTIAALASVNRQIADIVETQNGSVDLHQLEECLEELYEKRNELRETSVNVVEDYGVLVDLGNVSRTLQNLSDNEHTAVKLLKRFQEKKPPEPSKANYDELEPYNTEHFMETLRDNLNLRSLNFRHALRLGVAAAFTMLLYTTLGLNHGYWMALTVVVILKPDYGGTFNRAFSRVAGTVAGGIAGALIAATIHGHWTTYLIMFVLGVVAYAQLPNNYGLFVTFLTPFVILLIEISAPSDWHVALERIINTAIGGVIALVARYVFWPGWQRNLLPNQLAEAIEANRAYFCRVMAAYLGQENDPVAIRKSGEEANIEVSNAETDFQQLLDEPKRQQTNTDTFYALVTYNRAFWDHVTILASHLHFFRGNRRLEGLAEYAAKMDSSLKELKEAILYGNSTSKPEDFEEAFDPLQDALHDLTKKRVDEMANGLSNSPTREAIIDYEPVIRELKYLGQQIDGMYRQQQQLFDKDATTSQEPNANPV